MVINSYPLFFLALYLSIIQASLGGVVVVFP